MSTKDNKPDLSNLKSRLGLNKSAEKKESSSEQAATTGSGGHATQQGPSDGQSGQGVDERVSALRGSTQQPQQGQAQNTAAAGGGSAQQQSAAAGQANQAPRPKAGPPPGAQGPPPTAQAPVKQQTQQSTTHSSGGQSVDFDDADIDLGEYDLDQGGMFSPPVLVVFAVLLIVGLIFGFLASQSCQTRSIEQARIDDASQLQEQLEPRIADFASAHEIIQGLDPTDVDFQAAEQLGEYNFTLEARSLPGNRILLGDQIIGPLHHYMAEAHQLNQLMNEHARATTRSDREELEAFIEEQEKVGEGERIAVVFDLRYLQRHFMADEEPHEYSPLQGRLVSIAEDAEPDEDGSVRVHVLASDAPDTLDIRSLVPIVPQDFIDVDTDNAMQRYARRVSQMQELAEELEKRVTRLESSVDEAANADPPPLLTLRASAPDDDLEEEELPDLDDGGDE